MVEMSEMSFILRNATEKSLILLDEVGRGTSTFDGLSLAWALAEEILTRTACRTMFATHYHELTELSSHYAQAVNLQVGVDCREGEDVRFLYKLEAGAARRSYGISVAKLAGLPPRVLKRAETVLARLEARRARSSASPGATDVVVPQLGLGL
jgi:DNA mismatch repair protein MutS